MPIQIDGHHRYHLSTDGRHNWIVEQRKEAPEKSDKEFTWSRIGYYPTPKVALNRISEIDPMAVQPESFDELIEAYQNLQESIEDAATSIQEAQD